MSVEYPDFKEYVNTEGDFHNYGNKIDKMKDDDKITLNVPKINEVYSKIPLLKDVIIIINNCPNVKIEEFNYSIYGDGIKYVKLRLNNKTKCQNDLKIRFYIDGYNDKYYEINDLQFDKSEIKKFIKILNILSE